MQPDSIIPNPANPQSLNRFGYVLNNPIRFNDPTGHVCSDPDDLWSSPSCDGAGRPPINISAPLAHSPVVINNPDPLDDGLKQEKCKINCDLGLQQTSPPLKLDPLPREGNFIEAFDAIGNIAEGGFFLSLTIYATVYSCVTPACIVVLPIFFFMAVMFTQHMVNGIQEYRQKVYDPLIEPTGREVVDHIFPFLKRDK